MKLTGEITCREPIHPISSDRSNSRVLHPATSMSRVKFVTPWHIREFAYGWV